MKSLKMMPAMRAGELCDPKAANMMAVTARVRLHALRDALAASLVERDAEVDAVLLALVAREHCLFVGPPGCAKTLLASGLARALFGESFEILLTKFTTPEEVFGPVSIKALREDRFERVIAGYAACADVIFVDEIWKASSAIANSLLTLLQERAFDNGGVRIPCPLKLCVAASNEWPSSENGQELGAIFDRFLIRRRVRPVSPAARERLLYAPLPAVLACGTMTDVDEAADEAAMIPFGDAAKLALAEILDLLAKEGIKPGDRRCRKAVGIARAAAWLDGASEVLPRHLEPLGDVLWDDPAEQPEKCAAIVTRIANPVGAKLNEYLREVDQILASTVTGDAACRMAAIKKLETIEAKVATLMAEAAGNGRATKVKEYVHTEWIKLNAAALKIDPAKMAAFLGAKGGTQA